MKNFLAIIILSTTCFSMQSMSILRMLGYKKALTIDKHTEEAEKKAIRKKFKNALQQDFNTAKKLFGTPAITERFTTRYWQNGLHYAVFLGLYDACSNFLNTGVCADINEFDNKGLSPLHYATRDGHYDICMLLLVHGADSNIESYDEKELMPLSYAARSGHRAICELLLDNHAKINGNVDDSTTAVCCAIENNHYDICKLLIERGADIERTNSCDMSPLCIAAFEGHYNICQLLLDHKATINSKNYITPLGQAAGHGHVRICQLFLDNQADVNIRNSSNATPLCSAARNGYDHICVLLINKGADIEKPSHVYGGDPIGKTPLESAVSNYQLSTCVLLLEHGADPNRQNIKGDTSLHQAIRYAKYAKRNSDEDVSLEIEENLFKKQYLDSIAIFSLLIKHGARTDIPNNKGKTPAGMALEADIPLNTVIE